MIKINKILFIGLLICLASLTKADDPTTTPAVITTSTVPPTTTNTTTQTTPTTVTTTQTTTVTTQPTTVQPTTSTVTTQAPTTTTTPKPPSVILNFTIPENSTSPCLRARFALDLEIKYTGLINNQPANLTRLYPLQSVQSFTGVCGENFNTLELHFQDKWTIWFNYTLKNNMYQLDSLRFDYIVDTVEFPNATDIGPKSVEQNNLNDFSANKDNSFKCTSLTSIVLNNTVSFNFTNYQAQPFSAPDKKDYDTAVECAADLTGTSKLVPIIVGSALAVLVILVLVAYIIGRRKHRPGYQQV